MNTPIIIYLGIWLWIITNIIIASHKRRLAYKREENKDSRELARIQDPDYFKVVEWVDNIGYNKFGKAVIKRYERLGISVEDFQRKLKELS